MVTSVAKGGKHKLPKNIKIVETYWHDHSLQSTWGALYGGTIIYFIFGEKYIFWIYLKSLSS
jgi:hypothetical protein